LAKLAYGRSPHQLCHKIEKIKEKEKLWCMMVMVFVEFRFLVRKNKIVGTINVVSPIYVPMQSG